MLYFQNNIYLQWKVNLYHYETTHSKLDRLLLKLVVVGTNKITPNVTPNETRRNFSLIFHYGGYIVTSKPILSVKYDFMTKGYSNSWFLLFFQVYYICYNFY